LKIKIEDCKNPKTCMKCINVCPVKIIVLKPTGTKRLSDLVEKWKITAIFKKLCNECMNCVDACPNGLISLESGK
jgi:ferredoxin